MNPSTRRALDRALRSLSRPPRPRRSRFSTAPIVLGLALVLGYQLLVRLVPSVWASMLPGGLLMARHLRGWPGLVWSLAVACHDDFTTTLALGGGAVLAAGFLCAWVRPLRPLVWLAAVAAIATDAGILYVTLRTAIEATARSARIGL